MRTRKYIACFLFFVNTIMLTVPVIPHHHHEDSMICVKNDLPSNGRCHHQDACSEHYCCDIGCMAIYFFRQTPSPNDSDIQSYFVWVITLSVEPLPKLLTLPGETGIRQKFIYLESLHGTFITRATRLRAPPFVFA